MTASHGIPSLAESFTSVLFLMIFSVVHSIELVPISNFFLAYSTVISMMLFHVMTSKWFMSFIFVLVSLIFYSLLCISSTTISVTNVAIHSSIDIVYSLCSISVRIILSITLPFCYFTASASIISVLSYFAAFLSTKLTKYSIVEIYKLSILQLFYCANLTVVCITFWTFAHPHFELITFSNIFLQTFLSYIHFPASSEWFPFRTLP